MKRIRFLSLKDALLLHQDMMSHYSGYSGGIRSKELLQSAITEPRMSFGGSYLYETIYDMAAAYFYHVVKNHPFVDGNKRTGLLCALVFLENNNISIDASFDALYNLAIDVAKSKKSKEQIARFFKKYAKPTR